MAMTPLQILANIGLDLADLNLTTAALKTLRQAGSVWSTWTQAQATTKAIYGATTPALALKTYRIAQLLAHPELWLPSIDPGATVPRAMAAVAARSPAAVQEGAKYRYDVRIEVHYEHTGVQQPYYVGIDTTDRLSQQAVLDRAMIELEDRIIGAYRRTTTDVPNFTFESAEIVGFFRYTS